MLVIRHFSLQTAFMYYQQPMGNYMPSHAVYGIHFQNQQLRNQRVSAFAAGNTIATGTYLKGKLLIQILFENLTEMYLSIIRLPKRR